MIKNNESLVKITNRNITFLRNKGYIDKTLNIGDIAHIDVSKLSEKSHYKVTAICEICTLEKELDFSKYTKNKNNCDIYTCNICAKIKRIKTSQEKYGVEYPSQRKELREKQKQWMLSNDFIEKSISTQIGKYGCKYTQTSEFKVNISIKIIDNIRKKKEDGVYNSPLSMPSNIELRDKGMYNKYGHTYSHHVESIKDKIQNTNLEKFGHISPFGNKEVQKNIKDSIIYKSLDRKSKFNGDIYKIDLFNIYRRKVRYETDLIRKELFNNWQGYDYYDNEYIKENLILNSNSYNYPTIDHKISCFYGFINGLDTKEISCMENLCITKRYINVKKSHLIEKEFLELKIIK
jgi:hypothetical protein